MVGIKNKSGGKRKGAGRPKSDNPKQIISLRIEPDLIEYVNSKKNRSEFINNCIREKIERE
jgi:uncharacterized protein (DUF4415 family)|nr:MAG TPA: hypothetical protein [Bacteriophage sp.]